jgi:hypothetical protein
MQAQVDTLNIYNRLKSVKMDDKQAREIAAIFNEIIEQNLVTKRDLREALSETRSDLKIWVAGMLLAQTGLIFAMFKLFK